MAALFVSSSAVWHGAKGQEGTGAADPAQVQRRLEAPEAVPAPTAEEIEQEAPTTPALDLAVEQAFVLGSVAVEGSTVYEAAEFGPLYEDYLGRKIALPEIEEIADAITQKYRDDGYFLSRVVAPPQEVSFGILRLQVIEGSIDLVTLTGVEPDRRGLISSYYRHILYDRPIRLSVVERYVLLINDLPGLQVSANVRALNEEKGSFELVLGLDEDPFDGFASVDNRGTRSVGREQGLLLGGANSLLGLQERTRLSFFTVPPSPQELIYFEVMQEYPIGPEGTKVSLSASRTMIDAGAELGPRDVESGGERVVLSVTQPIIRQRSHSLYVGTKFDYLNFQEDEAGSNNYKDRLRVFRLWSSFSLNDDWDGANFFYVEASKGLSVLNPSSPNAPNLSRARGEADFLKILAEVSRRQSFGSAWALQLSGRGQKSANQLLSAEEFGLGGSRFGRGYDPFEISGDDGAALSVELQFGQFVNAGPLDSYQLYGFYDFGAVWQKEEVVGGAERDSLASTGVGFRAVLNQQFNVNLEVAQPLTRDDGQGNDPRGFFGVTASF